VKKAKVDENIMIEVKDLEAEAVSLCLKLQEENDNLEIHFVRNSSQTFAHGYKSYVFIAYRNEEGQFKEAKIPIFECERIFFRPYGAIYEGNLEAEIRKTIEELIRGMFSSPKTWIPYLWRIIFLLGVLIILIEFNRYTIAILLVFAWFFLFSLFRFWRWRSR
jgi:hypothetical protein